MAQILTVEQAAEKLQMSAKVVRDYMRLGKMPGCKVGRAWRVVDTDLERWISTGQPGRPKRVSLLGLLAHVEDLSSEDFARRKQEDIAIENRRVADGDK